MGAIPKYVYNPPREMAFENRVNLRFLSPHEEALYTTESCLGPGHASNTRRAPIKSGLNALLVIIDIVVRLARLHDEEIFNVSKDTVMVVLYEKSV